VVASEHDAKGRNNFDLIKAYYRSHKVTDYDPAQYYDAPRDQLTPLFYTGDRSMRESGFDPSSRFGPFSVDIIHYNPVCLNSLLYLMEIQTADMLGILSRPADATVWRTRAQSRAELVNKLLWDEPHGFYYDYDFVHSRVRRYPFLTTFYPLWAGFAGKDQAARVVKNLAVFERAGGLQTSSNHTGDQWDAPFGWAPLQWIAVQGLLRYGYKTEAGRISMRFLSLVIDDFGKHGTLEEKYDVVHRTSELSRQLRFGYHSNEAGFGWTNAVFTSLFDQLPGAEQKKLMHHR
jgi:alpha,alpha-trehalase